MELLNKIKENYVYIDRLLIPVSLQDVRMNIGLPIFVDWKHPPFKFNEIENISHILINKKDLINDCKDLINDTKYSLVSKKDCYQ